MNSDDFQSAKEKALTNDVNRLKTETPKLENRNKGLEGEFQSYYKIDKPTQ